MTEQMGNPDEPMSEGSADEQRLRGAHLEGAECDDAVDHTAYLKRRNPDTELHLDGEKDDLYNDGLDI